MVSRSNCDGSFVRWYFSSGIICSVVFWSPDLSVGGSNAAPGKERDHRSEENI